MNDVNRADINAAGDPEGEQKGGRLDAEFGHPGLETLLSLMELASTPLTDFEEFVGTLVDRLADFIDSEYLSVALLDAQEKKYHIFAGKGCLTFDDPKVQAVIVSLISHVRSSGKPLMVSRRDFERLTFAKHTIPDGNPPPTWLGVPLADKGEPIGVLSVRSFQQPTFTENEKAFLLHVAKVIVTAHSRRKDQHVGRSDDEGPDVGDSRQPRALQIAEHAHLAALFLSAPDAVAFLDADRSVTQVNPAFTEMFGYDLSDLCGRRLDELLTPKEHPDISFSLDRVQRSDIVQYEATKRCKDGSLLDVQVNVNQVSRNGSKSGFLVLYQTAAREEPRPGVGTGGEGRFEDLLSQIDVPAFIYAMDTEQLLDCNEVATVDYGYGREELRSMQFCHLHAEGQRTDSASLKTGSKTCIHVTKTGEHKTVRVVTLSIVHNGRPTLLSIVTDMGEIKSFEEELQNVKNELQAGKQQLSSAQQQLVASKTELIANEKALHQSEKQFKLISENASDLIGVLDRQGHFTYISPSVTTVLGYAQEELQGRWWFETVHHEDRGRALEAFHDSIHQMKGHVNEYRVQQKNASWRLMESATHVITDAAGEVDRLVMVSRDITARRDTEIELVKAQKISESVQIAKSEFLANMSHEVRTPLNGILGYTQLLREETLSEDQREFVEFIHLSASNLLGLINEVLDLTRLEARELALLEKRFSIRNLVNEKVNLVVPQLSSKAVRITTDVARAVPSSLIGDPTRIGQILLNLLSNAAKFTDRGEITVSLRKAKGKSTKGTDFPLEISVSDTGLGIPRDQHATIFHSFEQVDSSSSRKHNGPGLGLAIAQNLVKLMKGSIEVESVVARGSKFTVYLPLRTPDKAQKSQSKGRRRVPNSTATRPRKADLDDPPHLLLAEDQEVNWRFVKTIIERLGYRLTIVQNGIEVFDALEKDKFDLILMDMQMPEMDGFEATKKIRDLVEYKNLPIVALTAYAMPADEERCRKAGCDDYLTKPLSKDNLVECIHSFLGAGEQDNKQYDERPGEELRKEMAQLRGFYLATLRDRCARLSQAIEANDFDEVSMIGHGLKGSGSSYGFHEVSELGAGLEKAAQDQEISSTRKYQRLLEAFLSNNCALSESTN